MVVLWWDFRLVMASPANRRLGESGEIRSIPLGKRREISGEIAQQKRASVQEGKSARRTPLGRSDDSLIETGEGTTRRPRCLLIRDREVSSDSSLGEVPRSYRGRNTNPDEHSKWLAANELRQMTSGALSLRRGPENPKAFECQWLERQAAGGPVLAACTPLGL